MTEFLGPVQNYLFNLDLVLRTDHSVPEIPALLNRTVLLGGKRLRPALCFLMGQALGVKAEKMSPLARAAEFTHAASLAHDDVVDNAQTRRNSKTINAEATNKRAVLSGDLLLARVMVELSQQGSVEIINDLALVVEDLVNGEWLQMNIRGKVNVTHEELLAVSLRKTASLMSWCCLVAARLAKNTSADLQTMASDFGKNLGIAFQMIDDVIDFNEEGEKDFAKDMKEGIVNYVGCDLLRRNPHWESAVAALLGRESIEAPWTSEEIKISCDNIRDLSQTYLEKAQEKLLAIKKMCPPETDEAQQSFAALENLLSYLNQRDL